MNLRLRFIFSVTVLVGLPLFAEVDLPRRDWNAIWITHPTAPERDAVVLHFRRSLSLPLRPKTYVVRVSADNRFVLYVNGVRAGDGPARGDLNHWRYETFDLAPLLKSGENLITATVWNCGILSPWAQMSDRTGFVLESEATAVESISTPKGWLVEREEGERPLPRDPRISFPFMPAGVGEEWPARSFVPV